ncbi:TetR/AcrR family transcriptional regulator [Alteraurantiacibacter buctensis]|uniref:TetR family transcriptional regulator n=1 Tax=Alteraurantiacibacter buctensis TaxID=1503981 RepID=A0A844YXZ7_9SPHN|nr:TetR/AcrR family transcriptional regulator [Alteraurantiacibacter buctensis]MXO71896.1 TetR family transcriptional regulator [Alteraurantiacibacter buctensis]
MASKKPYHKEDLRGDLLAAARGWVAAHGHLGLSMRTLAQQVGVSPGAPYHHFPDRRALLLAVASEGFAEMLSLSRVAVAATGDPVARLRELGRVFVAFAAANPHLVDLMYESELTTPAIDPLLLDYQLGAHEMLSGAVVAACPDIDGAEAGLRSIAYWSAIYGFASMVRKGVIRSSRVLPSAEKLGDAVVERALRSAIGA